MMAKKNQSSRLTSQQKAGHGAIGIFGAEAKLHDTIIGDIQAAVFERLKKDFPQLTFRYRASISKKVKHNDTTIMLQAASIYAQGRGESWNVSDMFSIMLEIANTSLQVLWSDLFHQTK